QVTPAPPSDAAQLLEPRAVLRAHDLVAVLHTHAIHGAHADALRQRGVRHQSLHATGRRLHIGLDLLLAGTCTMALRGSVAGKCAEPGWRAFAAWREMMNGWPRRWLVCILWCSLS